MTEPSSDIRERGIYPGTHKTMNYALAARRRYDENMARRRRAHDELYRNQFRRKAAASTVKTPKKTRQWYACKRLGIDPDSDYVMPPNFRCEPKRDYTLTPERVFGEYAADPLEEILPRKTELVPFPKDSIESYPLWVLDAETLEAAYDWNDMNNQVWSTDPYDNIWMSVGLLLDDESFQHVRFQSLCDNPFFLIYIIPLIIYLL